MCVTVGMGVETVRCSVINGGI